MPDFFSSSRWYDAVYTVTRDFVRALLAFLQHDSFLYWPFLVSTVVIAMLAWRFGHARGDSGGPASWREFFRRFFGRSLWWHPSARVDYRYYLVNAVVFPLLVGPFLFGEQAIARLFDQAIEPVLGPGAGNAGSSGIAARLAYTVFFFLAYDFGRFVAHSLLHDVRVLWEFHKVHHSAEVLTPLTSFRAHPVDLAIMAWVPAVTTGIVTMLFHRFVDSGIGFYTFLGLHAVMWVFNLVGNLRHWHVWISYGATLNRWFISPAHHQLHHSSEPRHWGCNRGFELAIWDRCYGTLYVPSNEPETFHMGLGDDTDGRWRGVGRLYFWPFRFLMKPAERKVSSSAMVQLGIAAILPALWLLVPSFAAASELPIFDAHIHYSHDARDVLPPKTAVEILRKSGVRRALVSSSNDDGTQALVAEAPDLIIPELRPYRVRGDISTWARDETIVSYVEERLKRYRYVAIGEFHVYGSDADLPVVRRMVQLARERGIYIHIHSDADAVERVFRQDPGARVLWAHAGFDSPARVRELLLKHKNLWCDLAWRQDHAPEGRLNPEWRPLFLELPDRFLLGTDTPSPQRWYFIEEHARLARLWLSELPRNVAEKIAYRNGEAVFGPLAAALRSK